MTNAIIHTNLYSVGFIFTFLLPTGKTTDEDVCLDFSISSEVILIKQQGLAGRSLIG